jgi:ATP-dependent DNA helicase UvrD/PcrA
LKSRGRGSGAAAGGDQQPLALDAPAGPPPTAAPGSEAGGGKPDPEAVPRPRARGATKSKGSAASAAAPAAGAILEGLNDDQRDAVTHTGSPLLIVAGAGTGKTQVITRRIAWLIATKRARPDEILALTYTEKAAAEMEARVDVLVPYGYVGATISTFHAFCDRLVREHAVELGLTSRLRVDTPAEILVFLRERLFDLGLERYLPLGRPDEHLKSLLGLFDQARDEDVSPTQYRAFAERLMADAGDDPAKIDRAAAEIEKAAAYARFQELLAAHGRLDFGSQISLSLRLLRERDYLRREYQDRFRFILVDEFQDTNHVQFELVRLLAGRGHGVTVVGDDDQSIYRFRGAKLENLMGFVEAFEGAQVRVLKRNYRSRQQILDLAYRLIHENDPHRLEAALGFDKRLVADRAGEAEVEHRHFAAASDEAETIADEIADAIRSGRRSARDFAVLSRAHYMLEPFAQALFQRGVRFRRMAQRGLYARDEIQLCLNVLRMLADPEDPTAAHLVLGHALFGADPVDIARLGATARRRNRDVLKVAAAALDEGGGGLADATQAAIARVLNLHRRLAKTALSRPTTEVLYEFVSESGLLGGLTEREDAEALESVQNLNKLFGIVSRVGPLLKADRVGHFIRHLDLLIDMGDDPAVAEIESDDDAVSLLTAHNAKGLEFPVVYLVQLAEGRFPQHGRGDPMPFPPELRKGEPDDRDARYREERRLFYVGMTRARDRLVLSHADDYGGMRAYKMSRFVAEALLLAAAPRGPRAASALESIARHAPPVVPDPVAPAPLPDDHPLTLSHSQIDDYLTCPLKYRYANVANVPLATDPRAMYGLAIHHALRIYQQHRLKGLPITPDDVVAAFEGAWSSEGFYSREHEERRLEEGREALRRFVARASCEPVPLAVERTFKFKIGPTTVQGRWDRVDERHEGIVLVDYKTAEMDEAAEAEKRTQEDVRRGQLGLYALAYREMYGVTPAAVELHFVGPGTVGRAAVKPEHLEAAADRVFEAARGIRAAAFPPKPSARDCTFCPYSRFCPHSAARSRG